MSMTHGEFQHYTRDTVCCEPIYKDAWMVFALSNRRRPRQPMTVPLAEFADEEFDGSLDWSNARNGLDNIWLVRAFIGMQVDNQVAVKQPLAQVFAPRRLLMPAAVWILSAGSDTRLSSRPAAAVQKWRDR